MYYKTYYDSPIGNIVLVCDENSLIGLWLEGQKYYQATLHQEPIWNHEFAILKRAIAWLDAYFNGQKPKIHDVPLSLTGGPFRQRVWQILCKIPYGQVITYGDIAKQIAREDNIKTMSAQAVGNAVGHNPISIIVPCHRVVGASGSLTGYAGGLDKKIYLLKMEHVDMSKLHRPKKGTAL